MQKAEGRFFTAFRLLISAFSFLLVSKPPNSHAEEYRGEAQ